MKSKILKRKKRNIDSDNEISEQNSMKSKKIKKKKEERKFKLLQIAKNK